MSDKVEPGDVLRAAAADIRAQVSLAIRKDGQRKRSWLLRGPLSRTKAALLERRGHAYSGILAVASQLERRAARWDGTPNLLERYLQAVEDMGPDGVLQARIDEIRRDAHEGPDAVRGPVPDGSSPVLHPVVPLDSSVADDEPMNPTTAAEVPAYHAAEIEGQVIEPPYEFLLDHPRLRRYMDAVKQTSVSDHVRAVMAIAGEEIAAVTSWEDENACHGAHMVPQGHWTMEPHHYSVATLRR